MQYAVKLANWVLEREQMVKVDVGLSIYADYFLKLGEERNIDGAAIFIQHVLDTDMLRDNIVAENDYIDLSKQYPEFVYRIIDLLENTLEIDDEVYDILEEIDKE